MFSPKEHNLTTATLHLGIKANLLRSFATIPVTRMSQAPGERSRLYFLLAWLHAIVQERLRYAPLGKYSFQICGSASLINCDLQWT
jgi:dynein heavy chain 1